MNVYDFDKTLYRHDSSTDFMLYLYRKKPALLRFLPRQIGAALGHYLFRSLTKTQMKERFFSVFTACPDGAETFVPDFWRSHKKYLYSWYKELQQADDLVISASPRFLLKPLCRELGIRHLIASEVDPKSGRFSGLNCHGKEKRRRFREMFPEETIDRFFSDSFSDTPLAETARSAFLIRHHRPVPWKKK